MIAVLLYAKELDGWYTFICSFCSSNSGADPREGEHIATREGKKMVI